MMAALCTFFRNCIQWLGLGPVSSANCLFFNFSIFKIVVVVVHCFSIHLPAVSYHSCMWEMLQLFYSFLTHTHPFNRPFSGTTQVSRYQKGKNNQDFTEARDSEWQWHQLGRMQVCTSLQTDNHASTPPLSFLQAGCPSCRPTNSVNALKFYWTNHYCYFWASDDVVIRS